jgi:hypothetical protein
MFDSDFLDCKHSLVQKRLYDKKNHKHHRQPTLIDEWENDKTCFPVKNIITLSCKQTAGKKFEDMSYFFSKSNANKRLRNAIRSTIKNKNVDFDEYADLPSLECKKVMTWWDCGHSRHHRII